MNKSKYECCFSLGWFCGTASSLSKLGLRSVSGPFDWYLSDYWAVVQQLHDKFSDFMNPKNLVIDECNPKVFIDKKYGFVFPHEIDDNFVSEQKFIFNKYQKRIDRFLNMIKMPTLFVRCVKDEAEIQYINNNWEKAEATVKEYNKDNEIVYITLSDMGNLNENIISFQLSVDPGFS